MSEAFVVHLEDRCPQVGIDPDFDTFYPTHSREKLEHKKTSLFGKKDSRRYEIPEEVTTTTNAARKKLLERVMKSTKIKTPYNSSSNNTLINNDTKVRNKDKNILYSVENVLNKLPAGDDSWRTFSIQNYNSNIEANKSISTVDNNTSSKFLTEKILESSKNVMRFGDVASVYEKQETTRLLPKSEIVKRIREIDSKIIEKFEKNVFYKTDVKILLEHYKEHYNVRDNSSISEWKDKDFKRFPKFSKKFVFFKDDSRLYFPYQLLFNDAACEYPRKHLDLSHWSILHDDDFAVINAYNYEMESLNISNCKLITEKGLKMLEDCTALTSINVSGCNALNGDIVAEIICSYGLDQVISLDLSHTKITDEGIKMIVSSSGCKKSLNKLYLRDTRITNMSLLAIGNAMQDITGGGKLFLKVLDVSDSFHFNNEGLIYVLKRGIYCLEELKIINCLQLNELVTTGFTKGITNKIRVLDLSYSGIQNTGLRWIAEGCQGLENLNLSYCPSINDDGIDYISEYYDELKARAPAKKFNEFEHNISEYAKTFIPMRLKVFKIKWNKNISDASIAPFIAHIGSKLETVDFEGCWRIQNKTMKAMGMHCKDKLKFLNINFLCRITDRGFRDLTEGCKKIQYFSYCGDPSVAFNSRKGSIIRTTSQALISLASQNNKHLHTINFSGYPQLDDSCVAKIASFCPNLHIVHIQQCFRVTNKAVEDIAANCPLLRKLYCGHCKKIDGDKALTSLGAYSKDLEYLDIQQCYEMTDIGVINLAKGCPKLEYLNLKYCGDGITNLSIIHIAQHCRSLKTIILVGCINFTSLGLYAISQYSHQLETADFTNCGDLGGSDRKVLKEVVQQLLPFIQTDPNTSTSRPAHFISVPKTIKKFYKWYLFNLKEIFYAVKLQRVAKTFLQRTKYLLQLFNVKNAVIRIQAFVRMTRTRSWFVKALTEHKNNLIAISIIRKRVQMWIAQKFAKKKLEYLRHRWTLIIKVQSIVRMRKKRKLYLKKLVIAYRRILYNWKQCYDEVHRLEAMKYYMAAMLICKRCINRMIYKWRKRKRIKSIKIIQRNFRGFLCRKLLNLIKFSGIYDKTFSARCIQRNWKIYLVKKKFYRMLRVVTRQEEQQKLEFQKRTIASRRIQVWFRALKTIGTWIRMDILKISLIHKNATLVIQCFIRRCLAYYSKMRRLAILAEKEAYSLFIYMKWRRLLFLRIEWYHNVCATKIQNEYRSYRFELYKEECALRVQSFYRGHCGRKIGRTLQAVVNVSKLITIIKSIMKMFSILKKVRNSIAVRKSAWVICNILRRYIGKMRIWRRVREEHRLEAMQIVTEKVRSRNHKAERYLALIFHEKKGQFHEVHYERAAIKIQRCWKRILLETSMIGEERVAREAFMRTEFIAQKDYNENLNRLRKESKPLKKLERRLVKVGNKLKEATTTRHPQHIVNAVKNMKADGAGNKVEEELRDKEIYNAVIETQKRSTIKEGIKAIRFTYGEREKASFENEEATRRRNMIMNGERVKGLYTRINIDLSPDDAGLYLWYVRGTGKWTFTDIILNRGPRVKMTPEDKNSATVLWRQKGIVPFWHSVLDIEIHGYCAAALYGPEQCISRLEICNDADIDFVEQLTEEGFIKVKPSLAHFDSDHFADNNFIWYQKARSQPNNRRLQITHGRLAQYEWFDAKAKRAVEKYAIDAEKIIRIRELYEDFDLNEYDRAERSAFSQLFLRVEDSTLSEWFFKMCDPEHKNEMTFGEFFNVICMIAMMGQAEMLRFIFGIADEDQKGSIEKDQFERVLTALMENMDSKMVNPRKIMALFDKYKGEKYGDLFYSGFLEIFNRANIIVYPIVQLQEAIIQKVFGIEFWNEVKEKFAEQRHKIGLQKSLY